MWTGAKHKAGYGAFSVQEGKGAKGWRVRLAHRVSFFLAKDRWPAKLVLHKCDNQACVRPSHLYEGDNKQNAQDMMERGRLSPRRFMSRNRGVENANAKLTPENVAEIRRLYVPRKGGGGKENRAELALRFGVSPGTITRAFKGEHWS